MQSPVWQHLQAGFHFNASLRLAVEKEPSDGWWYVLRTDKRGKPLPGVDALGWAKTLHGGKKIAEQQSVTSQT